MPRSQDLEQTSLVPAWVKVLCPNATKVDLCGSTIAPQELHQPARAPAAAGVASPVVRGPRPAPAEHVRQELATLPTLTSLGLADMAWAGEGEGEDEQQQQAGRLVSSSVTRLALHDLRLERRVLQRLPTQFPCLRVLAMGITLVHDDGLEALLQGLPHLQRLSLRIFGLKRSHAHVAWPWREVTVDELDVRSFARLPLDRIPSCGGWSTLWPSDDKDAVARVAQAVRRWGGGGAETSDWAICGIHLDALLTTLGPLLAALTAQQQRHVTIHGMTDVSPQELERLGQQLPAGVASLRLTLGRLGTYSCRALLPNLPSSVRLLDLDLAEHQLLAVCGGAVRPITVVVGGLKQKTAGVHPQQPGTRRLGDFGDEHPLDQSAELRKGGGRLLCVFGFVPCLWCCARIALLSFCISPFGV